ncbi:MAG: family 16 glycoside hydrolase [Candidatus Bathyarchaeia archaeon]
MRRGHLLHLSIVLLLLVSLLFYLGPESRLYAGSSETGDAEHTYVIFEDDFEDGDAEDWDISIPLDAPPGSTWSVELDDGNYVLSEEGAVWADAGDLTWTDYTLEVKVKLLDVGTHINFRMSAPNIRYFFRFFSDELSLCKPPFETYLKNIKIEHDLNTWYTLKIVCVGNSIKIYVDDVLRIDYMDEEDPLLSGRIGLESGNLSHVHYDDVKVSVKGHTVSFSMDPSDAGYIRVDGDDCYDGDSADLPEGSCTIEAVPYSGWGFSGWRCGGGVSVSDPDSSPTTMDVSGDGWLKADYFERTPEALPQHHRWPTLRPLHSGGRERDRHRPYQRLRPPLPRTGGRGHHRVQARCRRLDLQGLLRPRRRVLPHLDAPPHPGEYEVDVHWPGDEKYHFFRWMDHFDVKPREEGPPPPPGPSEPAGPPIGIQTIVPPAILVAIVLAIAWARRRRRPPPMAVPAPLVPPSPIEARVLKVRNALERLDGMLRQGKVSAQVYRDLRAEYEAELRDLQRRLGPGR